MINLYSIRPKGFNVGNDVIYIAIQHFIREAFKNQEFNLISLPATNKYESNKKAGFTKSTIYEINQFGNGVILGGGNLYENGEIDVDPIAMKALDKPLMIFSVSRGKIYNKKLDLVDRTDVISDGKLKLLNEKAYISMSRDAATTEHISNLGLNTVNGACPTLFLNEVPQHQVPVNQNLKTDCLISIRTPNLMSVPPIFQYKLQDQLKEMISFLKENGYKNIKILCHDHRDIPFADSFENIEFLYTDDVYTFISLLKNTRLNITFRLHSFIPCLALGIPAIKVSYDQRAISLLDTIKMDEWNINYLFDDVVQEVKHRVKNIQELEKIKSDLNKSHWPKIKEIIRGNCKSFSEKVIAQR